MTLRTAMVALAFIHIFFGVLDATIDPKYAEAAGKALRGCIVND